MTTSPQPLLAIVAGTIAAIAIAITGGAALATAAHPAGERLEPLAPQVSDAASAVAGRHAALR